MNEVQDSTKEHSSEGGGFARFLRRVFCWRMVRRCLFVLACLATLIGLFYAVEDWRGKRAWEKCRRELEAKGEVLDWNAYIPAPVPDDQNIFKAPKMEEWFVKEAWNAPASGGPSKTGNTNVPFRRLPFWNAKRPPTLLAEVEVASSNGPLPPGKADAVLRHDDPAALEQTAKLLDGFTGLHVFSPRGEVIFARPLVQRKPLQLVLQTDTQPTVAGLSTFFSHGLV